MALFLAATIYFPATPPSPPSESAAAKRQQSGGGYARLLPTSPQAAWWYRPTQVVFKNWELYIIGIITSHQLQYCWCLCNTSVVILREVGTIKIDLQDSEVGVMLPNRPSIGTHPRGSISYPSIDVDPWKFLVTWELRHVVSGFWTYVFHCLLAAIRVGALFWISTWHMQLGFSNLMAQIDCKHHAEKKTLPRGYELDSSTTETQDVIQCSCTTWLCDDFVWCCRWYLWGRFKKETLWQTGPLCSLCQICLALWFFFIFSFVDTCMSELWHTSYILLPHTWIHKCCTVWFTHHQSCTRISKSVAPTKWHIVSIAKPKDILAWHDFHAHNGLTTPMPKELLLDWWPSACWVPSRVSFFCLQVWVEFRHTGSSQSGRRSNVRPRWSAKMWFWKQEKSKIVEVAKLVFRWFLYTIIHYPNVSNTYI